MNCARIWPIKRQESAANLVEPMPPLRRALRSSMARTILSLVLVMAILILLLGQISLTDITQLFADMSYRWIGLGVIFYGITNVGRAIRLRLLLPNQGTHYSRLLPITIAQSMFNNILPSRLGEVTLLYFLKKYEAVSLDRSTVALIAARIFDYIAVALMFVCASGLSMLKPLPDTFTVNIIWGAAGLMLMSVLAIFALAWQGQLLIDLLHRFLARLGLASHVLVKKVEAGLQRLLSAFLELHASRRYLAIISSSIFIWVTTFAWFYAFMQGLDVRVALLPTVVGSTFAVLSKAIPFISFGGLGAHEAGWAAGFMLVGLDKTLAISSGFAVNILTLLTSIILGIPALTWLWWLGRPT